MAEHKEQLQKRAQELNEEIVAIQKQFEVKKEEFLKVQGALEMLQIIENEKTEKTSSYIGSLDKFWRVCYIIPKSD